MNGVALVDVEKLSLDICKRVTLFTEQVLQGRRDVKDFPFCSSYAFKTYDFVINNDGVNMTFFKVILK